MRKLVKDKYPLKLLQKTKGQTGGEQRIKHCIYQDFTLDIRKRRNHQINDPKHMKYEHKFVFNQEWDTGGGKKDSQ